MNDELKGKQYSVHHSSLIVHHFIGSLIRPAGPEGMEPAACGVLLIDDLFEFTGIEPDAAAGVAAIDVYLVVCVLVKLPRAARAVHRHGPQPSIVRVLAYRLAETLKRLLVPALEILLFESSAAFVENV
jgi:hypothetical protein